MRSGSVGEATMKFNYNSEEINQVAVNQKANYLAAADDSGDIKVIDLEKCRLQRTLRGVHTNICSSVQFHPHRPWELISGGLDSKIVKWDFNKGRPLKILDQGVGAAQPGPCGQLFNPPFVHALAIPEGKVSGKTSRVLAVARGNGAVEICDVTLEKCHTLRSCNYPSQDLRNLGESTQLEICHREEDAMEGMHLSAVSTITFARFNGSKTYVISGGNDKCIKLWNWCNESKISTNPEGSSINSPIGQLLLNVPHTRKVNWICTAARSSEHIFVADTSKSLTVLTVT
ncbi:hypothetical protein KP509_35G048700 [Ceratopteris richardii]|nr:hypothetical protein KP509_35G048700 [Ceratopteris richardii]